MPRRHHGGAEIQSAGHEIRGVCRNLDVFGVAAPRAHAEDDRSSVWLLAEERAAHHAVAHLAVRHLRADSCHDSARIDAQHMRQRRPARILAGAHREIESAVDRDDMDLDDDFAGTRLGRRNLLEAQHLGRSERVKRDGLHLFSPTIRCSPLPTRLSPRSLRPPPSQQTRAPGPSSGPRHPPGRCGTAASGRRAPTSMPCDTRRNRTR